jgi:tRNA threonylcarbamoyladenosine biosynthesis protein TsaE
VNEAELVAWGERIGAEVEVPVVLALRGELGAGKSVLARAIARGAGVRGTMPSPTFNLVYRYHGSRAQGAGEEQTDGELEVWHLDLYRLEDEDEVWELGWRELGGDRQLVLIEWPERAEALLPESRWDIYLESAGAGRAEERIVRLVRQGAAPELPGMPEPSAR